MAASKPWRRALFLNSELDDRHGVLAKQADHMMIPMRVHAVRQTYHLQ